jgi:hypothetical protein
MIILSRRTFLVGTTAMTAAGLAPFGARAATPRTYHALLVACTDYPELPPKVTLVGPNHDAVLVRRYLLSDAPVTFAEENVKLLADNLAEAAGSPTHEGIKAALAEIAAKAEHGDFVYLHLSGHGAQQPQAKAGNEADALDEIFLPRDTGKWTDREKGVPNALMDDDIGAALDAIRAKGAFIWAVFDCCHSGTATRAALSDELERKVEAADLGIPEAEMMPSGGNARGLDEQGERKPAFSLTGPTGAESIAKGGLVAFYAAQSVETTPEMPLPKGSPEAEKLGLFTYTIFSKLAENPDVTYRQLGDAVLQQYTADGRTRPTPLFEGELDAPVFGSERVDAVLQWPIVVKDNAATIAAGLLHRLSRGSKLAILPSPLSDMSEAVGYLEVQSAKNLESRVRPVEFDGKPALKLADIPANARARVAELAVDYALLVARPAPSDGLDAETALVNSILDELVANPDKRFNVTLVEPGQGADIRFAVLRENAIAGAPADATDQPALWFLPASGDVILKDGSRPPLAIIHPGARAEFKETVDTNLTTIFRATSLSRLAAASDYRPEQVGVEFRIKRAATGAMEPLVASSVPRVFPGDQVHVVAKNQSTKPVDLNLLYVGSDYSITHIVAERMHGGAILEEGLLAFTDTSFGMERMIAVLTEAPPQSEMEDLGFLAQGGVPMRTRGAGDGEAGFADMLHDIGLAPSTRSAMKLGADGGSKGAVMIFSVETVRPAG